MRTVAARSVHVNVRVLWRLAGVLASVLSFDASAYAAPCGRADLLHAFPPDEATNVPVNATLFAHYSQSAAYLDEDVTLTRDNGSPENVAATFNENESLLSVVPSPALAENTAYDVAWPGLRSLNVASAGIGKSVHFVTGSATDDQAPQFEGLKSVEFDVESQQDECSDTVEQKFVFRFELADVSDDGGRESLALLLFQTKGPTVVDASPKPVMISPVPEAGQRLKLRRAVEDSVGDVCFAAIARDLTGKISASGATEVCTKTAEPPFFFGCTASAGRTRGFPAVSSLILAIALVRRRLQRR